VGGAINLGDARPIDHPKPIDMQPFAFGQGAQFGRCVTRDHYFKLLVQPLIQQHCRVCSGEQSLFIAIAQVPFHQEHAVAVKWQILLAKRVTLFQVDAVVDDRFGLVDLPLLSQPPIL
jgi:hypothetical protein